MNLISSLQNIYWREPLWLILAFQPFIFLLLKKLIQKNTLSLYVENKLQPWVVFPARHTLTKQLLSKNSTYVFAWLLFSIALAGPRIPISHIDKEKLFGANIMLVVDLSRSMNATDIEPNRLRRAKIEIYEFLEKAQNHRIGITVFAARPHLFVPLTSDHDVLKKYIESIDSLILPTIGSEPVEAILFAKNELIKTKGKSAIILLSDGDFTSAKNKQLEELKNEDIPLYTLGIGTIEGEAVQLNDGSWLKHNQQHVITKMNEDNLRLIATQLKGKYSPVRGDDSDWDVIYDQGISRHNTLAKISSEQSVLWDEFFPYFLIPSLFLFWFSLSTQQLKQFEKIITLTAISIVIYSIPVNNTYALEIGQTTEQSAYREYLIDNYNNAKKYYSNIAGYRSHIGQANSLYRMGHYQEAIKQYTFAILKAKDDTQRANALYNLGNSYFRSGDFSSASDTYKDVLRYQPDNKACFHNINISEILKKNIEQRIKQKIKPTIRQGKGTRSGKIADDTAINENTSVSIGDNENMLQKDIPLPKLPDINGDVIKKLILSGLKNITFADDGGVSNEQLDYQTRQNVDLIKAQEQLYNIDNSQHLLWKRLFEIEEGFPAPVDTPHTLPGVNPW